MRTANPADGSHTFQLKGTLYGEVQTVTFTVMIVATNACIITQFEATPVSDSLIYSLGDLVAIHDLSGVF